MIDQVDGLSAVAFCDVVETQAEDMRDEFGGAYATAEVDQVLADRDIEAVYVTTRHDSHADLCVRALAAGKHVMVEKPLAMTVEDCLRVAEAVNASDRVLMVAFKMRYFDMLHKARELMPDPQLLTMQMMDNRWPADAWYNDPAAGGGNVISQGCHATDVLRFVAGRDPVEVYAVGGNYYQETGVVDNLAATFRFEDGVAASWVQGDACCPPLVSKFFLQMYAEGRSITLSDRLTTLTYQEAGRDAKVFRGSETGFLEENVAFLKAIETDESPINVIDGLYATLMVLQAFRSLESGRPEPVREIVSRAAGEDGPGREGRAPLNPAKASRG
jgi:predicted dehydrogenase